MTTKLLLQDISEKFTEDLLISIIEKETKLSDIQIQKLQLGGDQKKGDSYMSSVTRFVAEGRGTDINSKREVQFSLPIFTKALIKNMARRKTFRATDFFRNEVNFFNHVWPALLLFQEEKEIPMPFLKIPRCFAAVSDGKNDFIAMQDLCFQNYRSLGREEDLSLDNTKLILQVFAQFHALNMAFKDQKPKEYKEMIHHLEETYFSEKYRNYYVKFQISLFNVIREAVKSHLSERYLEKFEELIEGDFYGYLISMVEHKGPLSVINHGDAWVPNFLFKYDQNGKTPISAFMIDFQLARYASPSMDITFFLYSCTTKALRDEHWTELIQYYHQEFIIMLVNLGSNPSLLPLEALHDDIKKNAKFGIGMAIEALPVSLLNDDDIFDPDSLQGNDAVPLESVLVVHPFKCVEKTKRIADFIQEVVDRGFI